MRGPACLSDLVLDEKLAGVALASEQSSHLAGCTECAARLAALAEDREDFAARARPRAFADAVLARPGGFPPQIRPRGACPRRWLAPLALAPALAAAAALLVWARPHPPAGERAKGAPVAVELYVRSGERTERFVEARPCRGGDTLQLVYTATAPRHLAVVDLEAGGKATLLYRSDGPLPRATRRRLDQSWVLEPGSAPERLYLVFTDGPPDEPALLDAARRADVERTVELDVRASAQASFRIR